MFIKKTLMLSIPLVGIPVAAIDIPSEYIGAGLIGMFTPDELNQTFALQPPQHNLRSYTSSSSSEVSSSEVSETASTDEMPQESPPINNSFFLEGIKASFFGAIAMIIIYSIYLLCESLLEEFLD